MRRKHASAGNTAPQDQFEARLAEIQAAGGGALEVHVIGPRDAAGLMAGATYGDAAADRLLRVLGSALRQIQAAPVSEPALCGTCPAPLRRGTFFGLS